MTFFYWSCWYNNCCIIILCNGWKNCCYTVHIYKKNLILINLPLCSKFKTFCWHGRWNTYLISVSIQPAKKCVSLFFWIYWRCNCSTIICYDRRNFSRSICFKCNRILFYLPARFIRDVFCWHLSWNLCRLTICIYPTGKCITLFCWVYRCCNIGVICLRNTFNCRPICINKRKRIGLYGPTCLNCHICCRHCGWYFLVPSSKSKAVFFWSWSNYWLAIFCCNSFECLIFIHECNGICIYHPICC